jgi:hypothetical protein
MISDKAMKELDKLRQKQQELTNWLIREYWVVEDSRKHGVFATDEMQQPKGYIPRTVGEIIIGRKTRDGECIWFDKEQIATMRAHPEFTTTLSTGGES